MSRSRLSAMRASPLAARASIGCRAAPAQNLYVLDLPRPPSPGRSKRY